MENVHIFIKKERGIFMQQFFKDKSKCLFIAGVLATLYIIYLVSYFASAMGSTIDSTQVIGGALTITIVLHT